MHPLTLMAVGLYGKSMPNQNGAPIRLVVPWKYGFKSIKSIVRIRVTEEQPQTTWQSLAPQEYGFYANVNPQVDHPRWSQASERRLPSTLFRPNRIPTQMLRRIGGTPLYNARFFCLVTDALAGVQFNSLYAASIAPQLAALASTHLPRRWACVPAPAVASAI